MGHRDSGMLDVISGSPPDGDWLNKQRTTEITPFLFLDNDSYPMPYAFMPVYDDFKFLLLSSPFFLYHFYLVYLSNRHTEKLKICTLHLESRSRNDRKIQ